MIERLPDKLVPLYWEGVNKRINILMGRDHRFFLKRFTSRLYDMGQNFDFLIRLLTKKKDINWLEIPGLENCSGAVASINDAGFMSAGWKHWLLEEIGVIEPAHVAPSHFAVVPDIYRRLKPGDDIPRGCVILNLSYDPVVRSINADLLRLVFNFRYVFQPVKFFSEFMDIFRDGIRLTQRDLLHHPEPFWRATHSMFVEENGPTLKIFSQEALAKEFHLTKHELWCDMAGEWPAKVALLPLFLYG